MFKPCVRARARVCVCVCARLHRKRRSRLSETLESAKFRLGESPGKLYHTADSFSK